MDPNQSHVGGKEAMVKVQENEEEQDLDWVLDLMSPESLVSESHSLTSGMGNANISDDLNNNNNNNNNNNQHKQVTFEPTFEEPSPPSNQRSSFPVPLQRLKSIPIPAVKPLAQEKVIDFCFFSISISPIYHFSFFFIRFPLLIFPPRSLTPALP
jgi:hypothetical protein